MNDVKITGRLGNDPKITEFDDGGKAASFSMAVTERAYTRQDGTEVPEKTEWINVETSNSGTATIIEKYVKKGSYVIIDGRLKNREWEKDGEKHRMLVVQIQRIELPPKTNGEQTAPPPPQQEAYAPKTGNNGFKNKPSSQSYSEPPSTMDDDDLPF